MAVGLLSTVLGNIDTNYKLHKFAADGSLRGPNAASNGLVGNCRHNPLHWRILPPNVANYETRDAHRLLASTAGGR